jgi:hypothetical protein
MRRKLRSEILDALGERLVLMEKVELRGDALITRWRVSGRNDRGIPALGIEANGKTLDVTAVTMDRAVDGQRVRTVYLDLAAVYAQLGDDVEPDADQEWSA